MTRIYLKKLRFDKQYLLDNNTRVKHIPHTLRDDKEYMIKFMSINGMNLMYLSKKGKLRHDLDVIKCALSQNGLSIKYVHPKILRGNPELYDIAFNNTHESVQYFGKLKDKSKYMLDQKDITPMLNKNTRCFDYIPLKYLTVDVLSKIIKIYDRLPDLYSVPNDILYNMDVMRLICSKHSLNTRCLRDQLHNHELLIHSINNNISNINYIPVETINDKQFLIKLFDSNISHKSYMMDYFVSKLINKLYYETIHDRDVAYSICCKTESYLCYVPEYLQDKEFILNVLKNTKSEYGYKIFSKASEEIRSDREVSLIAIERFPISIISDLSGLIDDKKFVINFLSNNTHLMRTTANQYTLTCVVLSHLLCNSKLSNDRDVILLCLKIDVNSYIYLENENKCIYEYIELYANNQEHKYMNSRLLCVPEKVRYDLNVMKLFVFNECDCGDCCSFDLDICFNDKKFNEMFQYLKDIGEYDYDDSKLHNLRKYVEINVNKRGKSARSVLQLTQSS